MSFMKKVLICIVLISALFIFSHKVNARYLAQVATETPTTEPTATPTGVLTELPQTGKVLPIIITVSIAGFLIYYGFREKII